MKKVKTLGVLDIKFCLPKAGDFSTELSHPKAER